MHFQVVGFGPDETPPSFMSAEVDDATLEITFDESLDTGSEPAASTFFVTVAGSRRTVDDVSIADDVVTLTLASPVDSGQAVMVRYTKPSLNPLQDATGNDVATFGDQTVTNNTAAPAVTGVEITSDPGLDSTYGLDEVIEVTVTFNKPVYVDLTGGRPQLEIDFHMASSGLQQATYRRGSGTSELVFGFTVVSANRSADGVKVVANRLQLNGGTIRSLGGADATLTYGALAHDTDHLVDGSADGSRVLVSNIAQTRLLAGNLASLDWAQGFTTGSSRSGYIVRDVEVHFTRGAVRVDRDAGDGAAVGCQHRGDVHESVDAGDGQPEVRRAGQHGAGSRHRLLGHRGRHIGQGRTRAVQRGGRARARRLEHRRQQPHPLRRILC